MPRPLELEEEGLQRRWGLLGGERLPRGNRVRLNDGNEHLSK
jgi:hypothetical protein